MARTSSTRILKYKLNTHGETIINMPVEFGPLHVDQQVRDGRAELMLWVEVNPESPPRDCRFHSFYTGELVPEATPTAEYYFVGTAKMYKGELIVHVYSIIESDPTPPGAVTFANGSTHDPATGIVRDVHGNQLDPNTGTVMGGTPTGEA